MVSLSFACDRPLEQNAKYGGDCNAKSVCDRGDAHSKFSPLSLLCPLIYEPKRVDKSHTIDDAAKQCKDQHDSKVGDDRLVEDVKEEGPEDDQLGRCEKMNVIHLNNVTTSAGEDRSNVGGKVEEDILC